MKSRSYFYCGWTTTLNVIAYALSRGRFIWLEGRITRDGFFHNWARRFRYRPLVRKPTSEQEIIEIIRQSKSVRLCGAGHSFNSGIESDSVLVSLDRYTGIVIEDLPEDLPKKQVTFRAGTRLRVVIQLLLELGLAFKALPSHNAQSIGKLLATDVHGTGRDWGWISELVVRLKVIDGNGTIHTVVPTEDLFRASVGGLGAVGIIAEVTVQARDRFNVKQTFVRADLREVEKNLGKIIQDNEHVSLYIFPFTDVCQINRWRQCNKRQSTLGPLREFINISLDALVSAWVGNLWLMLVS
jgi:FAD/FMN-containing dehydrogenase